MNLIKTLTKALKISEEIHILKEKRRQIKNTPIEVGNINKVLILIDEKIYSKLEILDNINPKENK